MPNLSGNKGEWSEAYTLLRLLGLGRLYAADEDLNQIDDMYFPVLKIFRQEQVGSKIEYDLPDSERVDIYINNNYIKSVQTTDCSTEANYLFTKIMEGGNRAFSISRTESFLASLGCHRLAAPSSDKTDISMQLHDIQTGYNSICGFSIKSEVGNAPTLINASKATNFVFRVIGLSHSDAAAINSIQSGNKIIDRMTMLFSCASDVQFIGTHSDTFDNNLMLIDSRMTELLSYARVSKSLIWMPEFCGHIPASFGITTFS